MCALVTGVQTCALPISKRSLSQASEALEISSRRKISLCEYSECVTRCRTWATSASKARVSVFVVIGAVRIAWPWTRGYARDGADFKLDGVRGCGIRAGIAGPRSEEHTSELQSLMRSSYAVFCLTKKNMQNLTRPLQRIAQYYLTQ